MEKVTKPIVLNETFSEKIGVINEQLSSIAQSCKTISADVPKVTTGTSGGGSTTITIINKDGTTTTELVDGTARASVDSLSNSVSTRMSAIETEQSVQSARMDTFTSLPEGSTSGNAELADIRVGADGTTYDTAGNAVRGQIGELKSDLTDYKSDLTDYKNGINHIPFDITQNEYVDHSGNITSFTGWGRTDYIKIEKGKSVTINVTVQSAYNALYDRDKVFQYYFATEIGDTVISAKERDIYIILSNTMAGIKGTKITEKVSVIKDNEVSVNFTYSSSKIEGLIKTQCAPNIKVVMPSTLVSLVDEEFDVHYDNIIQNYDADLIPYKEAFGGATYGMKNFGRNLVNVVQDTTGSFRFGKFLPDAYNSLSLPESIIRVPFTFKTISKDSGSGLNRKVLLIGDSWTAPGLYARELRNLFADENEPMNITLLGTLGDGGAEVGASNGYHEGHGGWSSKTFCTMQTYNGYTSHFFNPTTNEFDFSYYMNYCGYSDVDDVYINLGINDVATIESFDEIIGYYNQMITSIRAYKPTVKIFIGLCGLPAEYEYSTMHNNCQRSKARRLLFHERLMKEYGNKENEGFIIVPLHLSIDSKHDFKVEQKQRSFRDSTLVDYCTDIVHPSIIAYNKIADRIRTYIKYAETI